MTPDSPRRLSFLSRSLAVRLSVWFALLFAVGFTAIFALLYWLLAGQLEARDSEALQIRLRQYAAVYEAQGLGGLRARLAAEDDGPTVRSLFVRLMAPNGAVVWGKIPPDWIDADARRVTVPDGWGGWREQRIYTVRVPRDEQQDLAVVAQVLSDGVLLQVGRSTDSRTVLLAPLRRTFLWVGGAVVVVGFGVGFLAARRATRPLHSVVETARRIIETGALDARVPEPRRNDDVAELVRHFNTVLDQNAKLLRAMREALDNVAHDLRSPLTRLRGTAELALRESGENGAPAESVKNAAEITKEVDHAGIAHEAGSAAKDGESLRTDAAPAMREALGECVEQADDVLRLLRALMEISEAEAGMLKLEKTPCDLVEIVRRAGELYHDVAEAEGITLLLAPAEPLVVSADVVRLRQAVANLIDNAVKYTPAGGRVEVRVTREGDDGVVEVRDSGPGIPEHEQPRVWERLYRGDQSRSRSGLGLGLSLVRAIVEAHGGRATLHNAPEGGAVFRIMLPVGG